MTKASTPGELKGDRLFQGSTDIHSSWVPVKMVADAIDILEVKRDTNARPVKKQKVIQRKPGMSRYNLLDLI